MTTASLTALLNLLLALGVASLLLARAKNTSASRLKALAEERENRAEAAVSGVEWGGGGQKISNLGDSWGRAGFFTAAERQSAKAIRAALIGGVPIALSAALYAFSGTTAAAVGVAAGGYLGLLLWLSFLRYKTRQYSRLVLFQVPLFLESVILLVEAGLGILPAIERVVTSEEKSGENPALRLFRLVYSLSASGMSFSEALQTVAEASDLRVMRHVLLHLDISGNEGGELIPSLRSLSDHAHTEWRLSVEQRVRRLENFVVFPVFVSVMGLMLLTAAVPIVPLLDLKDRMGNASPGLAARNNQSALVVEGAK